MKAVKNAVEIAGARAAQARDGAALVALPRLVRPRGAERRAHRDRRGRRRWKASGATAGCSRTCRFRPSRAPAPTARSCITASPRKTNRKIAPGELFLIDSGGAIRGRHHRHHPHHRGRRAERRDARPLHARAQGPYRHRPRGVPRRHDRRAARLVRAAVLCGRPASISITAPATASAAICRCTRARRGSPSSARRRSSAA